MHFNERTLRESDTSHDEKDRRRTSEKKGNSMQEEIILKDILSRRRTKHDFVSEKEHHLTLPDINLRSLIQFAILLFSSLSLWYCLYPQRRGYVTKRRRMYNFSLSFILLVIVFFLLFIVIIDSISKIASPNFIFTLPWFHFIFVSSFFSLQNLFTPFVWHSMDFHF